jgi:hypothetical protein
MGLAPKWHFVSGLPSGSPEILTIGTPATLRVHNFVSKSRIKMKPKQSYNPRQELNNDMLHTTCT